MLQQLELVTLRFNDLRTGDGTTSGKYAYTLLQALQTSPQRWNVAMIGTTDYYVQDSTAGTTPFASESNSGNVGIRDDGTWGKSLDVVGSSLFSGNLYKTAEFQSAANERLAAGQFWLQHCNT